MNCNFKRSNLSIAPLDNTLKQNNDRSIPYDITISGTIRWTFVDENDISTLHNAKNITITCYDYDTHSIICSCKTGDNGYFYI